MVMKGSKTRVLGLKGHTCDVKVEFVYWDTGKGTNTIYVLQTFVFSGGKKKKA